VKQTETLRFELAAADGNSQRIRVFRSPNAEKTVTTALALAQSFQIDEKLGSVSDGFFGRKGTLLLQVLQFVDF
jgi:hypothetical protein